jgi:hypothetical protein
MVFDHTLAGLTLVGLTLVGLTEDEYGLRLACATSASPLRLAH